MGWQDRIVTDPNVLAGKPVIKGTRIAVELVLDLLARGWSTEQVMQQYDHIAPEDIQACLAYASEVVKSEKGASVRAEEGSGSLRILQQRRRNKRILVSVFVALAVMLGAMCVKHAFRKHDVAQRLKANYVPGHLKVDERYQRSITFMALGLTIPIRRENVFVRIDDPVDDVTEHQDKLHRELGYSPRVITLTNPAHNGREGFLTFGDGNRCAFIWVKKDPDEDITRGRIEHEKYHALYAIAREDVSLVSKRLQLVGFDVDLQHYDEELAATIIEIASIHLQGVPLRMISGSELVVCARDILSKSAVSPNTRPASQSSKRDVERGRS